jgi:hypothetical protein
MTLLVLDIRLAPGVGRDDNLTDGIFAVAWHRRGITSTWGASSSLEASSR